MDTIKALSQIDWWAIFFSVVIILLAFKILSELFDWIVKRFGIETKNQRQKREDHTLLLEMKEALDDSYIDREAIHKEMKTYSDNRVEDRKQSLKIQEELKDSIQRISDSACKNNDQIRYLVQAQKEILAEKINEKYKYYLSIDGIPADEYDEFVSLHKAYNDVGGNHHGDAKFEYCINHLKVLPVKTKLSTGDD